MNVLSGSPAVAPVSPIAGCRLTLPRNHHSVAKLLANLAAVVVGQNPCEWQLEQGGEAAANPNIYFDCALP